MFEYRNLNLEKMTPAQIRQFEQENHVRVFSKKLGQTFDDYREFGLQVIHFLDEDVIGSIPKRYRGKIFEKLGDDKHTAFWNTRMAFVNQITRGITDDLMSNGSYTVFPDWSYYSNEFEAKGNAIEQANDFWKSMDCCQFHNLQCMKSYNTRLEQSRNKGK